MRSVSAVLRAASGSLVVATVALGTTGCDNALPDVGAAPVVEIHGPRPVEYGSLDQLAEYASAIVLVTPTGRSLAEPLPAVQGGTKESVPATFLTVTVDEVLSGSVAAKSIEVASPGLDTRTGAEALSPGRQYVLFIAPAMNSANRPAGGYAVIGGPAGMYAEVADRFLKVDAGSGTLPQVLDLASATWPQVTYSEVELLTIGPRYARQGRPARIGGQSPYVVIGPDEG